MEKKTSNLSTQAYSKSNTSKYILIPLILIFLFLIGEGTYYFFFLKKGEKSPPQVGKTQEESAGEAERDGVKYYREEGGEKKLFVIQGFVEAIDQKGKKLTIKQGEVEEEVYFSQGDFVYFLTPNVPIDQAEKTEIKFSDIVVGNFISYNPGDPSTWVVQKIDEARE